MISIIQNGNFSRSFKWLKNLRKTTRLTWLDAYGAAGVDALSKATPVDTGKTASSWSYEIKRENSITSISWSNSNRTEDGTPIAILIQYGHGTGPGVYIPGKDFINPAIRPILEQIQKEITEKVVAL